MYIWGIGAAQAMICYVYLESHYENIHVYYRNLEFVQKEQSENFLTA